MGLKLWTYYHPPSVLAALALVPVGAPLALWFGLGLRSEWGLTLQDNVDIVQLITSSIVGGVAVDVFLLFQLPRMLRPRLHFCYLKHKDGSDMREAYLEVYRPELELTGGYWQWVHLRITNVGTIYYSRFTLACELPNEDWGGTYVISRDDDYYNLYKANGEQIKQFNPDLGRGPEYLRRYTLRQQKNQIDFEPRDDPRDTGPGDASVYSFCVRPPAVQERTSFKLQLRVAADQASGQTIKYLKMVVLPKPTPDTS